MVESAIQATFGFDTEPAKKDLNNLEQHAKSLAQRIKDFFRGGGDASPGINTDEAQKQLSKLEDKSKSTTEKITELFKRDPTKRAEQSFTEFARTLAGGDVTGAIDGLISRMNLFGLGVATAIGVAIAVTFKWIAQLAEARKAYGDLEGELAKPVHGLGVQGIQQDLAQAAAAIDQFVQKRQSFIQKLVESFRSGGIIGGAVAFVTGGREAAQTETAGELAHAFKHENDLRSQLAETERQIVEIRREGLSGSEQTAAIQKAELDTAEQKAMIDEQIYARQEQLRATLREDVAVKATGKVGLSEDVINTIKNEINALPALGEARKQAAESGLDLEKERINTLFNLANARTAVQRQEAEEALTGTSIAQQQHQALIDRLSLIEDQLRFEQQITTEKRAQLEADRLDVQAQLQKKTTQAIFQPFTTAQGLQQNVIEKQQQRFAQEKIRQQLLQDSGMGQVKPDWKSFEEKDRQALEKDLAERNERLQYGGMTRAEAYQSLTPEQRQGIPPPPGFEDLKQPVGRLAGLGESQDLVDQIEANRKAFEKQFAPPEEPGAPEQEKPKDESTKILELPDKVAKAVSDVMEKYWGSGTATT